MNPYTAIIIQTEHKPFSRDFFVSIGLIPPSEKIYYIPPTWVGAEYFSEFFATYGRKERPKKWREETILETNPFNRYLICDNDSCYGETFEVTMIRLVERRVKLENIWCISQDGNSEIRRTPILDKGIEWYNYRLRNKKPLRAALENLGFTYPSLKISKQILVSR
jgi:hypothetical protein